MPDTMMTAEHRIPENHSMEVAKLAAALAMAQKNFAPIPKDREVTVYSDRGNYKFKYATLDAIRTATMPALAEQTLAIVQGMIEYGNGYAVETKLIHSSGEWIRNVTPMFVSGRVKDGRQYPPTNQELGSAQSYARRYGISALLCITADEDDDGNTADGNHIEGGSRAAYTPHKPGVGSAAAGTDFRPPGPRRTGWAKEAENDGLIDESRQKGKLPAAKSPGIPINTPAAAGNAIKRIAWVKESVAFLRQESTDEHIARDWWTENKTRIDIIETAIPTEYERLLDAYNEALERKVDA